MKKIFFILTVFIFHICFAYGDELITENASNSCNFNLAHQTLIAQFEPNEYTCAPGYYLPADATSCTSCLSGYICVGGTYTFNENADQGLNINPIITTNVTNGCNMSDTKQFFALFEPNEYTCAPGYYLPANVDECTICSLNSFCTGGTYSFNETIDQGIQSCTENYYSPTGSTVCYPHILHVGDNNIYLRSDKLTTPSVNIKIGNDIFYANMTTTPTFMNKSSIRYLRVKYNDMDYYVCDDTTCPE